MLEGTVLRRTLSRSELLSAPNVFQSVGRDVRQCRVAAQVDPVRTHELFGVKPILLAPNVSDCVEMPLQPRFTSERCSTVSCCQGHEHVLKECRTDDEGAHIVGPIHDKDQGCAPRRKHHLCGCQTFPLRRCVCQQTPRDFSPDVMNCDACICQCRRCSVFGLNVPPCLDRWVSASTGRVPHQC